eukprot:1765435-Rhodomonas_salina.1
MSNAFDSALQPHACASAKSGMRCEACRAHVVLGLSTLCDVRYRASVCCYDQVWTSTRQLCEASQVSPAIALRACYAMSGTDIAYGATRRGGGTCSIRHTPP